MVAVRLLRVFIFPETFVLLIIIHGKSLTGPAFVTFYPEVVIGLTRQPAVTASGLQDALRQGDRGGYTRFLHLTDGDVFVLFNIFFCRDAALCREEDRDHQQEDE